jgi:hypothetical protein
MGRLPRYSIVLAFALSLGAGHGRLAAAAPPGGTDPAGEAPEEGAADFPALDDQVAIEVAAEQERGVGLAREGRFPEGLAVLEPLLAAHPGYYPLERDLTVIAAWRGDCRGAVRRFESIRDRAEPEPYLILPVADCLGRMGRREEAAALLDAGRREWPDDPDLPAAYAAARRASHLRNELRLELGTDDSDQGEREWLWSATLGRRLSDRTRVYLRSTNSRSRDGQLEDGNFYRAGLGIDQVLFDDLVVTQEFSDDVRRGGRTGSFTQAVYLPGERWRVGASYASFAEDLPLRARAQSIEATRTAAFADFHTFDYRWSWNAYGSHHEFSDGNRRDALSSSLGYAYELKPRREQRVLLEYYSSENDLAGAAYFNPAHDQGVTLVHKTDFVFASRFRRHVDHVYLRAGLYDQEGFAAGGVWGLRYEQDYDLTDRAALLYGVDYGRQVYDGGAEYETSLYGVFRWLF